MRVESSLDTGLGELVQGLCAGRSRQLTLRLTAKDVININLTTALVDVVAAGLAPPAPPLRVACVFFVLVCCLTPNWRGRAAD